MTEGKILKIRDIFLTFQGEGPYTGHSALFIRLSGCNLACTFCDTEFEYFEEKTVEEIIKTSMNLLEGSKCSLAVITGGEPFLQPIGLLCTTLLKRGFKVQIESNGILYQKIPDEVEVVCSPKISNGKYYKVRKDLEKHIIAYKFLVATNIEGYGEIPSWDFNRRVYVQAIDLYEPEKNSANIKLAMEIAMKKGYIFSLQTHKIVGIK